MTRSAKAILAGALFLAARGFGAASTDPEGLFPRASGITLPDGTVAGSWEKPAAYSRTYYVDQHHPDASDANEGTAERPFRTISRAAQVVQAGERVLVRAGVYREQVQPAHGGEGPDRMVTYEAAPGEAVIIRGSCVLPKAWQPAPEQPATKPTTLWTLRLPEAEFAAYNPFAHDNLDERDGNIYDLNAWRQMGKVPPYTHKRGLIFQDGRRLKQVTHLADLAGEAGTYWVAEEGLVVYARLFADANPNSALMEATSRRQCFAPKPPGVSYLRLKGFIIEQVGDAFSYPVEAAVSPMGGDHWIIEDNIIRQVNGDGINIGNHVWTWGGDRRSHAGWDCIVRRNTISDCGVSGIKGLCPVNCVIEDNCLERIGWQGVEFWYDNGGLKLLVCRNTLVRHNLIRDMVAAPAVWLDWENVNCRVTQNVVLDVQNRGGGIFLEASEKTNWIDHNVVWNIKGNGIYQHDCDGLVVFDNLIGRCTDSAIRMQVCTKRKLYGREVTCKHNQMRGNVMVDNQRSIFLGDPDNASDYNVIANARDPRALATWQKASGKDIHSRQMPIPAMLNGQSLTLEWRVPTELTTFAGDTPGPFGRATTLRRTVLLFQPPSLPQTGGPQ
jgi:alpha-L-arabinofuranosidase